ncbi:hypothetical protein BRADI_1g16082v3 [Brachypodium distachyon]|uniref:Uncharacterized protein n=1 Tax=Brachypodium distachyon TaxID=15368 RepID=A0A0Q3GU61_BRADI|nr:hypothetical protein BRADI_1g16082v3 [Brachypodium distachyon]
MDVTFFWIISEFNRRYFFSDVEDARRTVLGQSIFEMTGDYDIFSCGHNVGIGLDVSLLRGNLWAIWN